ncbi:bifunctional rhamnulose-1-phosphate aldolase/short-chain dehydrogenase [Siculibacillus lacustris]|uniref:Bifunctional rhamnulose-1-phosphate aldolase/short-chain dehydrogenase n=1 Tax=Siculibacillus lacustris TaxID=1549641 RepID=A0A4Q9VY05_9HYPH|nr:bifunctional rhamnulose-1-phosphate aldolase/short-chain dehydrogenase [Siculibacillus lacustris]TBW41389.1 bifunctional rhamnulose-1-phosphate aldolase/short-chain dehydrogenase [Siculibacillus lacustris]
MTVTGSRLADLWDDGLAASMSEAERLRYRSNLLGSDRRITNFGGGNTSAKIVETDPLTGAAVEVLWVKGSGGDIGTIGLDGFATLYMDKLALLKGLHRGPAHEDETVERLAHCTFGLNPRAASIDTPLHAFVPFCHVDHMHPDAVIALAASKDGEAATAAIFGSEIGWLPWRRPGFELGLTLERFVRDHPQAVGVILESHGLFTWADSAKACYATTIRIVNRAIEAIAAATAGRPAFGGPARRALAPAERREVAAVLMPAIRGLISADEAKVGHFDDGDTVLDFVTSAELHSLAALGTSCPDHFLRTKIRPLVIDFDPESPDLAATIGGLAAAVAAYRDDYAAYYDRCRHPDSPARRDANAIVHLVPGVGMITFAKDKATARIAGEFYVNAINVMRDAARLSAYVGLPEREAFDIEYWALEEAKLRRMPKPRRLAGKIALVTGGAGGIGRAVAERLLRDGACVMLADVDAPSLLAAEAELAARHSADVVRGVTLDVTREDQVAAAFAATAVAFGGLDILVSNAGIASSAPIDETDLALWNRNMDILSTGYFLVSRQAFRLMKTQKIGGAIVFVASKNGLAASPNAAAYCTAKAAEIHLARCLALEGAEFAIRVNTVNPDMVLRGSKIWSGEWRAQRAAAYAADPADLEELYRKRSLLKRSVFPEDVAEAVAFFVGDESSKSTGNILNVDAGNAQAFPR